MRINAGKFRNTNIEMTNLETTRETSDKVRQAMFNLIGQFFDGEIALDLFSGSGALGLEAISRGCSLCYFNDINKKAMDIIVKNQKKLKLSNECINSCLDYNECLKSLNGKKIDLIFLDPPYRMNNVDDILLLIMKYELLSPNGMIIFEMQNNTLPNSQYFNILKDKTYGIKRVVVYQNK